MASPTQVASQLAQFTWYTTLFAISDLVLRVNQERSDGVDRLVVGADVVVSENVGELFYISLESPAMCLYF